MMAVGQSESQSILSYFSKRYCLQCRIYCGWQKSFFLCHDAMTKWESPNDVLKQLPDLSFLGLGILTSQQPPTITSPLAIAGRVPQAGITEGATPPTKNIQFQAQVSRTTKSDSVKPWVQVALEVSPFGALHPLLLRCSSRPVSTDIPRSWSGPQWG